MKKNKFILGMILLLTVLLIPLPVKAKSEERSSDMEKLIDEINTYVKENNRNEAAVAVGLVSKDQIIFEENYGYADKKMMIRADANTVYEWGSLSKVLTWISVMQLWEQNKIDLNEDIRVYLPEGFLTKLSYDIPITMLDLMNHTGGFQDSITNVYTTNPDEIVSLGEYVKLYEPIQIYEPGTTVAYSNWGCSLAGFIVENISGESYCDYVKTHIFDPLHMTQTSIDPLRRDNSYVNDKLNEITGYTTEGDVISGRYYAPDYPAAGAAGTVTDIILFMQDLLSQNGGKLFVNASTYEEFFSSTFSYSGTNKSENCHGMWNDFYEVETAGHYGNTVQFSVHMSLSDELGLIVMTNQAQEMKINEGLGEIVFGSTIPKSITKTEWKNLKFLDCYTSARTIEKGFCKFYHFFGIYRVNGTDTDSLTLSSMMMPMPLKRLGETEYVVTDGFAKGYHVFMDVDEDGIVQKIATSTFDFIPYSSKLAIVETLSFISFAIVFIILFIILILWIIKRKKKSYADPITGIMIILSLSYYGVVFMEMKHLITTAATKNEMYGFVIFYVCYLILGLGYSVRNVIKKRWNSLVTLTSICYLVLAIFILYWEMIMI